ncbi:Hypothetical predicted protein [Podarcis lilfordi]|uniref:Uncharacterized protein n=1 Tax=Podarcis lilfordi TaxID=74358 RepID=A0AA35PGK5_9SAUR|nr:Hypothetical predicted protein [Podarcis lilfordi]
MHKRLPSGSSSAASKKCDFVDHVSMMFLRHEVAHGTLIPSLQSETCLLRSNPSRNSRTSSKYMDIPVGCSYNLFYVLIWFFEPTAYKPIALGSNLQDIFSCIKPQRIGILKDDLRKVGSFIQNDNLWTSLLVRPVPLAEKNRHCGQP